MEFIAMNRFRVRPDSTDIFESFWKERQSRLKEVKGFQEFRLLKGPEKDGCRLYSSHVIWDSQEDFEAWTRSEQFRDAHKNAGNSASKNAVMGHPEFEGFETLMHEN